MRRVGALQLRNIIGNGARIVRFEFLVAARQETLERRLGGVTGISDRDPGHCWSSNLSVHEISLNTEDLSNPCAIAASSLGYWDRLLATLVRHPDARCRFPGDRTQKQGSRQAEQQVGVSERTSSPDRDAAAKEAAHRALQHRTMIKRGAPTSVQQAASPGGLNRRGQTSNTTDAEFTG